MIKARYKKIGFWDLAIGDIIVSDEDKFYYVKNFGRTIIHRHFRVKLLRLHSDTYYLHNERTETEENFSLDNFYLVARFLDIGWCSWMEKKRR